MSEKIVISKSELSDPRVDDMVMMERAARRPVSAAERAPVETGLLLNPIFYTAVAGMIGALVAWAIIEPLIDKTGARGRGESGVGLILLLPLASAFVGMGTGLIEGVMSRNFIKAFRCGGIGLGVGVLWGAVGMFIAGFIYQFLQAIGWSMFGGSWRPDPDNPMNIPSGLLFMQIVARSLAWTVVAAGMGVGRGVAEWSKKLILNGVVGGLIGGFIGGLLFDPIGLALKSIMPHTGAPSRAIGLACIGMMVGVFIGLVENLSKDAWFIMKTGPLRGKQFVIYNNPMVIGSSPKCDIYIFKDAAIEPKHAEVYQVGSKFEIRDCRSAQGVYVDNKKVDRKTLEKGDIVVIGESVLEFDQRDRG